jgi:hypothetical protein
VNALESRNAKRQQATAAAENVFKKKAKQIHHPKTSLTLDYYLAE